MPAYPPVSFYFKVCFKGGGISGEGSFKEVSGLEVSLGEDDVVKEGGELRFAHHLPTPPTYKNLILRRGLLSNSSLRTWIEKAIFTFQFEPVIATILLLNANAKPVLVWVAHNVRPVKWEVSKFDAMQKDDAIAYESLELAYDRFQIKQAS